MLHTIYIICFTVGGIYAVLSFIFGNLLDLDFDLDFNFDFSAVLLPLKPFTLMVFVTVFGGIGLISLNYINPLLTLLPAIFVGVLVSVGLYYLMFVKLRRYETHTLSEDDSLMQRAEVVERIVPGGYGKISYTLNGNILSGAARENKPGNGINKGCNVYIVDIRDNTYFVCEDLELYINEYLK